MKNRVKALAQHLGCKKSEVENLEEADELWEESLDSYLEECIYPELHGNLSSYFDDEKWKKDARYDGCENEETVKEVTYYIYRTN